MFNSSGHRDVWRLAWPMILSNISIPLLGAVDTAILGHLDSVSYLGAVAVGASILTFLLWGFGFLRMGTTSLVARAMGREDYSRCRLLLVQSALLGLALAVLLILFQGLLFPLALNWMNPSDQVADWAMSYCQIRIVSAPATLINYAIIGWFIGLQNTRSPLMIMVFANLLNIVLDWFFILVLDMKSDGAALATVVAEYSSLVLALTLVKQKLSGLEGQLDRRLLTQLDAYIDLFQVNRHLFVRTACLLFTFAFFTAQGAQHSDTVLAANAILLQLLMLTSYGLDGFAHAAEALAGRAIGSGSITAFLRVCRTTTFWALLTASAFTLFFLIFKQPLIMLFSDIPEVINITGEYYAWLCLLPLIGVWCYQLDGIFIGSGKTRAMQNMMLISLFGVFLPLWWATQAYGNHGLWLALLAFLLARTLGMGWCFYHFSHRNQWL